MREKDIDRLEGDLYRQARSQTPPPAPADFQASVMAEVRRRARAGRTARRSGLSGLWERLNGLFAASGPRAGAVGPQAASGWLASPLYALGAATALAILIYAFTARVQVPDSLSLARLDRARITLAAYRLY